MKRNLRNKETNQKIQTAAVKPLAASESPAIHEYRRRLEGETSKLQLIGLDPKEPRTLPIDQAYVPLNVVLARGFKSELPFHFDEDELRQYEYFDNNVPVCEVFRRAAQFDESAWRGVLLLGEAGAGKTTSAQYFCWRVLTAPDFAHTVGLPGDVLPAFIRLRNLTRHHLDNGLQSFVNESIAASSLPADQANPGPELWKRKRVLWVFDGLDEVVRIEDRVRVCQWIKDAFNHRLDDFFLVTSRYLGCDGPLGLLPEFCQFHVRPLDEEQALIFVDHWNRSVSRKVLGPGEAAETQATRLIASLNDLLRQPEYRTGRLREMRANPFSLNILCAAHRRDRERLPHRHRDFCAKCVREMLKNSPKGALEDHSSAGFNPGLVESVLASIAWDLHEKERTTVSIEELGRVAEKALAEISPSFGLGRDGEEFIRRMYHENGILTRRSDGKWGFRHRTLQEYLAGLHAVHKGWAAELAARFNQGWYREVILVAVAVGSGNFALNFFTVLLQTDAVSCEDDFFEQCLVELRDPILDPFIDALSAKDTKPEQKLGILRRLRLFNHTRLSDVCRELAILGHIELSALAQEILQRSGVTGERLGISIVGVPPKLHVDTRTGIAFIHVPVGEFEMGSKEGHSDEKPVHRIHLSQPFLLGKYLVTNREYQRFLEENPSVEVPRYWTDSQFSDPNQPVVGVSWEDVQAFCRWAHCRLPTEAEWEYACRAGSRQKFCFGDTDSYLAEFAWYGKNSGGKSQPVGAKKPNAWGLLDMHGNVWEWCQDWYGKDYYGLSPNLDPTGPVNGGARVLRGGSWYHNTPDFLRSSRRLYTTSADRSNSIGFRVVWLEQS